jgi:hypothetical protein
MLSNAADAWRPLCRRASALMRKDFILMPMSIGRNADGYPRLPLATVAVANLPMRLGQTANMPRPYRRCLAPIMRPSLGQKAHNYAP